MLLWIYNRLLKLAAKSPKGTFIIISLLLTTAVVIVYTAAQIGYAVVESVHDYKREVALQKEETVGLTENQETLLIGNCRVGAFYHIASQRWLYVTDQGSCSVAVGNTSE